MCEHELKIYAEDTVFFWKQRAIMLDNVDRKKTEQLAAANARVAELELSNKRWSVVADDLKQLSEAEKQRAEKAEAKVSTLSIKLNEMSIKLRNVDVAREQAEAKLASHAPDGHQYSNQQFIDMRLAKEQAEAQCAALAESYCGECDYDHDICRGTQPDMKCAVRELDNSKSAQLLYRMKRMEDALKEIADDNCDKKNCTVGPCVNCLQNIAKASLEEKP